jgi:hypothetical protein
VTPLQKVAMGLVIVVLDSASAYDVLPDLVGWVLVLGGVRSFPGEYRGGLLATAGIAAAVSAVLWFPQVRDPVIDEGPAIAWAAALPDYVFAIWLCWTLARLAQPDDPTTAARMRLLAAVLVVPALGPAVDAAVRSDTLVAGATVVGMVGWVWLIWTLFSRHARPWAPARA